MSENQKKYIKKLKKKKIIIVLIQIFIVITFILIWEYLANKNIKVANVPLVPEIPLPKELDDINPNKIIGLTNTPEKLNKIRQERLKALGLSSNANYANIERILQELEYSDTIMKRLGCPVIDVSNKAIEETAGIILDLIKENGINTVKVKDKK